jgi:hypothetical protein
MARTPLLALASGIFFIKRVTVVTAGFAIGR